jgi:hypothetical protein
MKVIQRSNDLSIIPVFLIVNPKLPELAPGGRSPNRLIPTVQENKLASLFLHHRYPVTPLIGTDEAGDATSKISDQLPPCLVGILLANQDQITLELPRCSRKILFIRPHPFIASGYLRNFAFVCKNSEHDKRMLEGKRSALPVI